MAAQLEDITHTIQLAVAPVFLLSAIGTSLGVFATRLGRIIDRARRVEGQLEDAAQPDHQALIDELRQLDRRTRLIHLALTFATVAAILVGLLIAVAFVGYLVDVNLGAAVAVLFIVSVLAFVAALVFFLQEVFQAIAQMRFRYPAEVVAPPPTSSGPPPGP